MFAFIGLMTFEYRRVWAIQQDDGTLDQHKMTHKLTGPA